MQFNLSPDSSTNTFSNQSLIHPLSIGNEFMPHPKNEFSEEIQKDLETIAEFAQSQDWVDCANYEKLLKKGINSLVISDYNQKILYVSSGFEHMTGYSKKFSQGKKANFLQGMNTEHDAIQTIRKAIEKREFVECVLTNYRKNGESYLCNIRIFPMFNKKNELKNFMALGNEIYA